MANTPGYSRCVLLLALILSLLGMSACVVADGKEKAFDIPAQSAASALNEFAKQADITLIFSYDLVAGENTRSLKGRFTVGDGLTRLLHGTALGYRQAVDGAYLICPSSSCELAPPAASEGLVPLAEATRVGDSGIPSQARLQDEPVTLPET